MKTRVYDISKQYGLENALIIDLLQRLGCKDVKRPSNELNELMVEYLVWKLGLKGKVPAPPAPGKGASGDDRKMRANW